jgi:hypothetical protein
MNKSARWMLGAAAIFVIGLALVGGGIYFGRMSGSGGYGPNMMNGYAATGNSSFGAMGGSMMAGGNMMGGNMMGGASGMMSVSGNVALYGIQPLSISAAQSAVEAYIAGLRNSDLAVGEVLIFDNQAYARIDEKSTGHAALEVLVDPVTLAVYPEPGANMMWNIKYGMLSNPGTSMMGGAMAFSPAYPLPVTPEQAVETAQGFLDTYLLGAKAEATTDAFYGYYTLEILRNGQMAGMLSVNGYTRQVILHTWHGRFIETSAK